jgi:prepilin-type N-terminal cleavage/methylation domain-containing protein
VPRLTRGPRRPRRAPAGFTLAELLVTVVILAFVGAAINRMLVGQLRMFNRAQGATRIQRDLRTGLGLLPVDLRGAARESRTLADLTELRDSSIGLRATLGSSIVCGRPGLNDVDLPPVGTARNTLTSWYTQPLAGDTLLVYNDSTSAGPEDDVWTARRITAIVPLVSASGVVPCSATPYMHPTLDAGKPRWRVTLDARVPDSVKTGAPVRFLRSVRYSLFQPAPPAGQWYLGYREFVSGAWSPTLPIAGPFERYAAGTGSGIRFAYFDTLGQPLATPANGTRVGRIDLVLRARALLRGGTTDSVVLRDSVAARVALRNRL